MNRRKFTASLGGSRTVKIFDAETGSLLRSVNTSGEIIGSPTADGSEMHVNVKEGGRSYLQYYNLPSGSLIKKVPS